MAELLERGADPAETAAHLAEAERRLALAAEDVEDPFVLNRLKELEFRVWELRTTLAD